MITIVIILCVIMVPIIVLSDCWENGKSIKENFKEMLGKR